MYTVCIFLRDSPKEGRKGAAPLCTKRCTHVHAHARSPCVGLRMLKRYCGCGRVCTRSRKWREGLQSSLTTGLLQNVHGQTSRRHLLTTDQPHRYQLTTDQPLSVRALPVRPSLQTVSHIIREKESTKSATTLAGKPNLTG